MNTQKQNAILVRDALVHAEKLLEKQIINLGITEVIPAHSEISRAIPAAQALVDGVGDGWQPIETAPKTGKTIILYGKTRHADFDHVGVGHWYKTYNRWAYDGYLGDEPKQPTHWMLLPKPPAMKGNNL